MYTEYYILWKKKIIKKNVNNAHTDLSVDTRFLDGFLCFSEQKHKQLHIVILDHFSVCVRIIGKQRADNKEHTKNKWSNFLMNSTGD